MEIPEFNRTAVSSEDSENIYFDLRPFGERQSEALDAYLNDALARLEINTNLVPEHPVVLQIDPTVELVDSSRNCLVHLRNAGLAISVQVRR